MRETVGESRFWDLLWKQYSAAPSVVLCRVPEQEYASTLDVKGGVLDHCCRNGRFASLAWRTESDAGAGYFITAMRS